MRAFVLLVILLLAGSNVWQHQTCLKQAQQLGAAERRNELLEGHWLDAGHQVNRQVVMIGDLRQQIIALQSAW